MSSCNSVVLTMNSAIEGYIICLKCNIINCLGSNEGAI